VVYISHVPAERLRAFAGELVGADTGFPSNSVVWPTPPWNLQRHIAAATKRPRTYSPQSAAIDEIRATRHTGAQALLETPVCSPDARIPGV